MFGGNGQSVFGDNGYLNRAREAELQLDVSYKTIKNLKEELKDVKDSKLTLSQMVVSLIPTLSGTRSVLREALVELKNSDSDNPILKKSDRDLIFTDAFDRTFKEFKDLSIPKLESILNSGKFRHDAFGVKDESTMSGPEMSLLTPNISLRTKVNFPSNHKTNLSYLKDSSDKLEAACGILRKEVIALDESELSSTCSIAGVKGVTRELLEELRKSDPKNPLLDKKIRERVFDAAFKDSLSKIKGKNFSERSTLKNQWNKESFGSESSGKIGPEKSEITPNLMIRSEAEVPSHISDREKFFGLIERLTAEVKKNNPNAEILKDKVMLDVFSDYTLNEMERQEKNKTV